VNTGMDEDRGGDSAVVVVVADNTLMVVVVVGRASSGMYAVAASAKVIGARGGRDWQGCCCAVAKVVAVRRRNRDGLSVEWMTSPPNLATAVVVVAVALKVAGILVLRIQNSRPSQRPLENDPSPFVS